MRLNLSFMATTELPRGGFSPVMLAAREGALDSARVLADAKANLDLQDPEGTTALMLAIMNVHYDVALMLVEKGANPNVYDKAAMGALYAVVDMRTQTAADEHAAAQAVQRRGFDLDVVKALLKHGADVNAVLKTTTLRRHHSTGDGSLGEGTTPLMRAARFGDAAAMRVLIEGGCGRVESGSETATPRCCLRPAWDSKSATADLRARTGNGRRRHRRDQTVFRRRVRT